MPKKAKELTALAVRRLTTPGSHCVGGVDGLRLNITEGGSRSWVLRASVKGKQREIGLGGFPDVTLEMARDNARAMREQIRRQVDPLDERNRQRAATAATTARSKTYEAVARECHESLAPGFKNAKHAAQWLATQETYAFPLIGQIPVSEVTLEHVLSVIKPIWQTKPETASRVRGRIQKTLSFAKVKGYRTGENPAMWGDNLKLVLPTLSTIRKVEHHPAMPISELPAFVRRLQGIDSFGARALEFLILTACRSADVRLATAPEFDFERRVWTIPGSRMKRPRDHRVPLTPHMIEILKGLDFRAKYIFQGRLSGTPLSDGTLRKILIDMDMEYVPHGFRSTFKDWARTTTSFADEASELALAHVNNDATRAAYARDELLDIRRAMMEQWNAFCLSVQR
jgi:integrase